MSMCVYWTIWPRDLYVIVCVYWILRSRDLYGIVSVVNYMTTSFICDCLCIEL